MNTVLPPIHKGPRVEEKRAEVLQPGKTVWSSHENEKVLLKHGLGEPGTVAKKKDGGMVHYH